jgi:enterochelin esterase-like enzyme
MVEAQARTVTETFAYNGGRAATAHFPSATPEAIVFAADGQYAAYLVAALHASEAPPTLVVGVHGQSTDEGRLREYSRGADPAQFAAHEHLFVRDVGEWVHTSLGISLPRERTAVWGASLGGEFALAMGLHHRDTYGVVFSASPGGGYRPPITWPRPLPRVYMLAGTQEPFFLENAQRWANALRAANADVVMQERPGEHGGAFWVQEFPLMVRWAFGS